MPQPTNPPHLFTIHKDNEVSYAVIDTPNQYWVIPVEDIKNLNHLEGGGETIDLDADLFAEFMVENNLPVLDAENPIEHPCLEFIPELLEVCELSTIWSTEFVTQYERIYNGLETVTPTQKLEIEVG
mgnify:CR=1 FL=1